MNNISLFHPTNITPHILPCAHVMNLDYEERCNFIRRTAGCHKSTHYFDYLEFIFCHVGANGEYDYFGAIAVIFAICFYMFITLGTTADKFFCPALAVLSKMLGLSENLGGITLLAFGNGAPDIFTSLLNANGDTELMYTQLLGGATYVTGFIIGIVLIIRPTHLPMRNYLRDVTFFICAALFIHNSMHDQIYAIYEGILTLSIYFLYILVVVIDHMLMKRKIRKIKQRSRRASDTESLKADMRLAEDLESVTSIQIRNRKNSSVMLNEEILRVFRQDFSRRDANADLFGKFWRDVSPIKCDDWRRSGWLKRIFLILQAPVMLVLTLLIPLVDFSEGLHGWSKLLSLVNILVLPQAILLSCGYFLATFFFIPVSVIVLLVSLAIAYSVHRTSRNDCPPSYHAVFAVGSFAGSILVIYNMAKEVVSVMTAVGIISSMSDSMVGLSVLAWGNNIGDTFSNIALAKQGYQQMAFAACFGGPMFNTLLGIGLTFIIKGLQSSSNLAHTREGALGPNCIIFLILILTFTLFALMLTNFRGRKSIGCFSIGMYVTFLVYCLLGELEIMHPYGTDHQET